MQIAQNAIRSGTLHVKTWEVGVLVECFEQERIDLLQTAPSRNRHQLKVIQVGAITLWHIVQGAPWVATTTGHPGEVSAVVFLNPPGAPCRVGGKRLPKQALLWYRGTQSCFFRAPEPNQFVLLTMSEAAFGQMLEKAGGDGELEPASLAEVIAAESFFIEELRKVLRRIIAQANGDGGGRGEHSHLEEEVGTKLLKVLKDGLLTNNGAHKGSHSDSYKRIVLECRRYLDDHLGNAVYLRDLCSAAGCGERRVQQAFITLLGVTPMEYVRLRRLRQARAALLENVAGVSVKKAALEAGFCDLGRFAVDYQQVFGEKPSATLRRAQRNGAGRA